MTGHPRTPAEISASKTSNLHRTPTAFTERPLDDIGLRLVGRALPRNHQSAGKRRSGRTRNGSKWLGIALHEAALAAIRSKNTYLAAQYQRLKARLGHGRALGAVKHSMLIAYWHMFTTGETYRDLGGDYFAHRDPQRATKRLVGKLQALGHIVTLEPAAA